MVRAACTTFSGNEEVSAFSGNEEVSEDRLLDDSASHVTRLARKAMRWHIHTCMHAVVTGVQGVVCVRVFV